MRSTLPKHLYCWIMHEEWNALLAVGFAFVFHIHLDRFGKKIAAESLGNVETTCVRPSWQAQLLQLSVGVLQPQSCYSETKKKTKQKLTQHRKSTKEALNWPIKRTPTPISDCKMWKSLKIFIFPCFCFVAPPTAERVPRESTRFMDLCIWASLGRD